MSDSPNGMTASAAPLPVAPAHPPFPFVRLLYAIGFGFIAWFVLHIVFVVAAVQFILLAINGRTNAELKNFCAALLRYEVEVLAYILFIREQEPFPFAPFPTAQPQ